MASQPEFYKLYPQVLALKIPDPCKLLLSIILSWNLSGKPCKQSNSTLSKHLQKSQRQIRRYLQIMEEYGMIERTEEDRGRDIWATQSMRSKLTGGRLILTGGEVENDHIGRSDKVKGEGVIVHQLEKRLEKFY